MKSAPLPSESAASCPKCGQSWEFVISGALSPIPGVVTAKHPPGPCIPLPEVPRDRQPVGDPALCAYEGCRREFVKHSNAQKYCSGKCCEKGCKHSGNRARLRRYWQRVERDQLQAEVRAYQRRSGRAA